MPKKSREKSTAPVVVARQVGDVQRRHAEHLPGAFGVGGGDDRRVDPEEAVLVEVAVDRLGEAVADARDRAEQVGARAQVRDLAQEFQRVRLGLDRVGFRIVDPADHFDRFGLDLEALALALRGHQRAGGDHRAAGGEPLHFGFVVGQRARRDDLDRREAGAVADVDERQPGLGVAPRAHPAADRDFAAFGHLARERLRNADRGHALNPCRIEPI